MAHLKRVLFKNKNFKPFYYAKALLRELSILPWYRFQLKSKLKNRPDYDLNAIETRVNYYNKLQGKQPLSPFAIPLYQFKIPQKIRVYYFDTKQYLRYFNPRFYFEMIPGDVVDIPAYPAIVKSRPIAENNQNAVLLNLDKIRHFNFIQDPTPFWKKKDKLIGRSAAHQAHRRRFLEMYFDHPLCDLGDVVKSNPSPWYKEPISINQHLQYKFILSLEGNDVATNLKWIMSSNSIAVMPAPKYETWFMEGKLQPYVHYIPIRDDYSDLEEQLRYYIAHPERAEKIIENAHAYVRQFQNQAIEDTISLRVLQKYFEKTEQSV